MDFLRPRTNKTHFSLWINDMKPDKLADIVGNYQIIKTLSLYIATGNIPHLLLTGPNGTGKKCMAELLAKEYLGEYYDTGCLTIDGSIYRGKDIITNTNDLKKTSSDIIGDMPNIMLFTKYKMRLGDKKRIIIIYNFDRMTPPAQNAMRRIIEINSKNSRFILVCNDLTDVIEAIQSRCTLLSTTIVSDTEIKDLLKSLLVKNGFPESHISDDLLETICLLSDGDMKKAINYLQVISQSETPSVDTFYKIFNIPPAQNIEKIIMATQSSETYQEAYDTLDKLLENGYDASDILGIFVSVVARCQKLPVQTRVAFMQGIARCSVKTEMVPSNSHLFALVARMGKIATEGYTEEVI